MSLNININTTLNMNDFLLLFKKFYRYIKDNFPKKESDITFDELVKLYSDNEKFPNKIEHIKILLNDIDESMKYIDFKYDEYYNFLSIKNMITYIIQDVTKIIKYTPFILTLLKAFNNLINSQNNPNYKNNYEKFDIFLDEKEDVFYSEIYESTHDYDNLIDKVTNILG